MATFTILNTGAGMLVADEIRILDRLGNVVFIDTLQLDSGQSRIITVPDMSGDVTLTALDNTLSGSVTTTCEFPPQISVAPSCISNQVTFTIHNADGPMIAPQSYEVRDASNGLILSDSFQIARNGADVVVTVPNLYSPYTFTSDGAVGTFSVTHECNPQPTLVVTTSDCSTSTISFTVQNTSSNPMVIPQSFTITRNGSADVTPPPGEFQLNGGETVTFTLPGGSNPYGQYVFVSNGFAGNLTATHDCANPALSVTTNTCGPSVDFTVSNSGGDMLIAQSFTVTQDGIDVTAGVTPGSSFQLASGAAQTFTVAAGSDPYATYVFATDGLAGTHSLTHRCDAPGLSDLSVTTNACSDTITFTVTNSGGDMLVPQGFTLTQDGQDVTPSVTSGGAPAQEFMLARDSSQIFTVAVGSDPYAAYMFSTSGFAGAATSMHDCDHPNLSVATSICGAGVDFTITNGAGAGNMLAAQSFTITRDGAVDLTPAPGSFQLDAGESITVTLPDDVNPYARYDFTTDGFAAQMQQTHHCARPILVASTTCTAPVAFTVVNQGGPMLKPHHFTITPDGGYELEPRTNQFQLASGKSITFTLHGADLYSSYAFRSDEFGILSEAMHRCEAPQPPAVLPDITISQPSDRASSTLTPEYLRLNGISTDVLAMPAWTTVPVCHQGCPPWLVYHTDQTGNWEIFRLDGVDTVQRKTLNVNLSHGEGPGIDDMAPGRSPNGEWIVFTSNRDGNWEIYVAPTNGDASQVRRLTYNHVAIDTDPIWGPTNYVAYESTRDGNWEIYMMDMATGREYRITDSPASDINPFWSSDGSRLVFQSNRDGIWQIYELNLDTFKVTRLSDSQGNDLDPQYSFDGTRIAFRSYRDGASSGIYVMNADGTNPQPISALDGDATNHAWSPDDQFIAYQSDRDGDLDIYIYAVATGKTRQLTDNAIPDYAPMWKCDSETVVFTSDITGNPDIFAADALPVDAGPVDLLEDGNQMTFGTSEDIYPEGMPPEENASREGRLPPVTNRIGEQGQVLGLQTDFLRPDTTLTPPDLSLDGVRAHELPSINACPIATRR
jgi:Tol biopolymer transport system component/archaellum component FlaF (FlaF/FlaG flagellin family)